MKAVSEIVDFNLFIFNCICSRGKCSRDMQIFSMFGGLGL